MYFLREFVTFMLTRKRYWLYPAVLAMLVLGGLIVLSQSSAVAPFVYTIF